MTLIVTTSLAPTETVQAEAVRFAAELNVAYFPRIKLGLAKLWDATGAGRMLIVGSDALTLAHRDGTEYRYHPNLGFIRALNVLRGQRDLFLEAAELTPGEHVLDCTLGFGSEALIAALLVADGGEVVGLESVPELAVVTREGLSRRQMVQPEIQNAMRRITVVPEDYRDYLARLEPGRFDLIYFDPFFHERIEGSEININPLLRFGNPAPLDCASVQKAITLAARRVLVKHPRKVELPEPLPQLRTKLVSARHGPVAYSVFDARRSRG